MTVRFYIPDLLDETSLIDNCFATLPGTCVVVLVNTPTSDPMKDPKLLGVNAANEKIATTTKNYRFYRVTNDKPHAHAFIEKLGLSGPGHPTVVAVNSHKRWFKEFKGEPSMENILDWLDAIKFGDVKKDKLPKGAYEPEEEVKHEEKPVEQEEGKLVVEEVKDEEVKEKVEEIEEEVKAAKGHDEL